MIKIFSPDNINREDVIKLWQESFGDSREYVEFFLDNCPDYVCIEYFSEDKLASMLFLLEGKLASEKCKYLYAACTDISFRRQGIMEKLITFTKKYCLEQSYSSIFLVPATDKLYSYYAKLGFIDSFRKKVLSTTNNFSSDAESDETDIQKIFQTKKQLLKTFEGFSFSDDVIKYTIKEHLYNNGKVFLDSTENNETLAFYYKHQQNYVVKEFLFRQDCLTAEKFQQFNNKNVENIYIFTPMVYNNKDIVEKYTKCGMAFPLNSKLSDFLKKHTDLYAGMYLD